MTRRLLGCLFVALAFALFADSASADIPGGRRTPRPAPPPSEPTPAPLTIRREVPSKRHESVEARLVIPRKYLEELVKAGAAPGGVGDAGGGRIPWTTVLAGAALSLAAISGVWVARRREARWAAAAAVVVALTCGAWNLAQGDLLVPGGKPRPPRRPEGPKGASQILIETTDEGDSVTLILRP